MVGGASTVKIDKATMAKVDEAEAAKSSKEVTLVDAWKVAAETASTSPRTRDQLGGHCGEREIHTISSNEPPRPHGKGVLDVEVSSTAKMVVPPASEGPEVKGSLALVPVGTDPWVDPVPIFLGDFEEAEEAHYAVLGGFRRLVEQSLRMALHILTRDLANATEVSPFLFSQSIPPAPEFL
jgi:hypothetical protein